MRKIVILGSTGSIGTQTLDVIFANPGEFQVIGLSAHENAELFEKQIREFQPKYILQTAVSENPEQALRSLAQTAEADLIVNAISGSAGLMPTYAACKAGKKIALANKESLVMAGELLMDICKQTGAQILPVDSEPSAIWQILEGRAANSIEKIILTASGGPFYGRTREELKNIPTNQAANHPTWRMGVKVSIDSATLMNKAFEIIETRWLFDVPPEKIDVTIHRQSIVHSFVQFCDGNTQAVLSNPDMRLPISYALFYPHRRSEKFPRLDFENLTLTFEKPDYTVFEGPKLAYEALSAGGLMPAALCAADETAVKKFLAGEISFLGIYDFIKRALGKFKNEKFSIEAANNLNRRPEFNSE